MQAPTAQSLERPPPVAVLHADQAAIDAEFAAIVAANWTIESDHATRIRTGLHDDRPNPQPDPAAPSQDHDGIPRARRAVPRTRSPPDAAPTHRP